MDQLYTIYASAARTATPTVADLEVRSYKGAIFVLNVTAVTATPSLTFKVEGVDSEGVVHLILTSAAIATAVQTVFRVFPGATVTTNISANSFLPRVIRVTVTHGDTDSATYSLTASFMP